MFGSEYNWLVTPVRSARGLTVRLVRNSLLTLGVGAFCLSCTLLPYRAPLAHVAGVAAPGATTIKETAQSELPRFLLRLWVLVPYLLPQR
jgi:hypothetical protein